MKGLAVSGGGLYGIYFLGMVDYLQETGRDQEYTHFAGTSAGSIVSYALALGYPAKVLAEKGIQFAIETDLRAILKNSMLSIVKKYGLIDSDAFFRDLFRTYQFPNFTFREVYEKTGKSLLINAMCVNTRKETVFSEVDTPDYLVLDAIMHSCTVPFVFTPNGEKSKLFIDGATCGYECPEHLLLKRGVPKERVVKIHFDYHLNTTALCWDLSSFVSETVSVLYNILRPHEGPCDSRCIHVPLKDFLDMTEMFRSEEYLVTQVLQMTEAGKRITEDWYSFPKEKEGNDSMQEGLQMQNWNNRGTMRVQKRNGSLEPISFDKILRRIFRLADPSPDEPHLNPIWTNIDCCRIAQQVISSLHDHIKTSDLDTLTAETAISYSTEHPDYGVLASRVEISNLQKSTPDTFSEVLEKYTSISDHVKRMYLAHSETIESALDYRRDFLFDYFAIKTLLRSYLQCDASGLVIERPQHMWMRVALGIHDDVDLAVESYHAMSQLYFTHATPTLFNAGTTRPQMSSCFLMTIDDSIQGIYKSLADCAQISKWCGGIGINVSNIRGRDSYIEGTNGKSSGIVPMLKVFNDTARYVNQGGKRLGSFAMYLEPWHCDVLEFLDMKKNAGHDSERARDLFYAMWIPDLFMRRVKEKGTWSLFSPDRATGLTSTYGKEFEALYETYEAEKRYVRQVPAMDVWTRILESQIETGVPYMMYKDHCNEKSNQKNLGTIQCSNLCTEITQFTSPTETAVCNLASICLPKMVRDGAFDFEQLRTVTKIIVHNLNQVIDKNFYPVSEAKTSNLMHRPIGIGVQGLADLFAILNITWESPEAKKLNQEIFENIYFAALEKSCELAKVDGPYATFHGSPASRGILQYHMWGKEPLTEGILPWDDLIERIKTHGIRNSLLVAPMPTASTGQIMGNNECIEPFTSNLYLRRVLSGEFVVVNKHLVERLLQLGLWSKELKNEIILHRGSIQNIAVPDDLKRVFKTVWEIPQKRIIELAADRGAFICQSQSLNLFVPSNKLNFNVLSAMHMFNWESGNKGSYYLRTQAAATAVPVTMDPSKVCESCSA